MKKLYVLVLVSIVSIAQGCAMINFEGFNQDGQRARDGGNYQTAIEKWETGLAEARAHHNKPYIITFLRNLIDTNIYQNQFQFQKGLEICEELLILARELSLPAQEAHALYKIGLLYHALEEYQKELEFYEQALRVIRPLNNFEEEAWILYRMSNAYSHIEQHWQAKEFAEQALALAPKVEGFEAQALGRLGNVYGGLGQFKQAIEYMQKAVATARQRNDYMWVAINLRDLGDIYSWNRKDKEATESWEQALPFVRKYMREWFAPMEVLVKLGKGYRNLGAYEQAVKSYEEAVDDLEAIRLGFTTQEQVSHLQRYMNVYDELFDLLQLLHQQKPGEGYDRKALDIFERKQGRLFLSEMARSGARHFSGVPDALLQQVSEVEVQLEHIHTRLVAERARPAEQARFKITPLSFQNLRQNGIPKPVLEQLKSLEDLEFTKTDLFTAVEAAIGREATRTYTDLLLQNLVALLDELEARERVLTAEQETLHAQIKRDYPDYYALQNPQPVSFAELQQQVLQPGELILLYAVMEEKTMVWILSRDIGQMFGLFLGEKKLQYGVNELRKALRIEYEKTRGLPRTMKDSELPERSFVELSHDLYTQLIPEEIRPLLSQAQTLTIVPTGPLYTLPFEALVTSPDPKPHYLIEDVAINYLSSASLLKILRDSETRRTTPPIYPLLAFADPVYGTRTSTSPSAGNEEQARRTEAYRAFFQDGFTQLPETAEEVQAIATALKAPQESEPLQLKELASRSNVFAFHENGRLDEYRYLVFATHGVLPGEVDQITQPALVLSYPEQDGYLTMADVFQLKCNADLISLSACNTGMGEQQANEGVIGLTRAFMFAGTPVVSVTLWSVESQSAKELNVGLFEHLAAGQSPAQALQAAKLSLLRGEKGERYQHPYYWAPFVLFGDGQ